MKQMTSSRERIRRTLQFEVADRVPLLGGWILGDEQQQAIAGVSAEQYWRDPEKYAIQAHRALGVDGMIMVMVPEKPGEYRNPEFYSQEKLTRAKRRYESPEDVLAFVQSLPSSEAALDEFNADAWRDDFRAKILMMQRKMEDMIYLPTLWEVVHPKFEWYWEFGYESYLMFMQLYPQAADKLFESEVGICRRKAEIVLHLYDELDMVPLTLIGTDICGGGGPIISPKLLREFYFPHVRRAIEPLREAGFRTVWHSDGDFRLIIDDLIACGVSGFQGFQEEYGVDIADLVTRRTVDGDPLTIFAGPSVSTTLPFGGVEDVRKDVERIIDTLAGECALFILPANNILPDCPVDNIEAMYRHAAEHSHRQ